MRSPRADRSHQPSGYASCPGSITYTAPGCDRYLDQIRVAISELGRVDPATLSDRARTDLLAAFRGWRAERN